MEAGVFLLLLTVFSFSPRTVANLVVQPSKLNRSGGIGLTKEQAD